MIKVTISKLKFLPVTIDNWKDFESLFGKRGACGGCWCMWSRIKRSEFEKQKGESNKRAMKKLVRGGTIPGILAYIDNLPIGWCSVAPREHFSALARSRVLKPVDNKEVWSIVCLFVNKEYRRSGVSTALIKEAVKFANANGAKIIEAYPVEPRKKIMPDVFAYYGLPSAYLKAGFKEVARRSESRPIMRKMIRTSGKK